MQSYPHHYKVNGQSAPSGDVNLSADGVSDLPSAPPIEFDGPGDKWSPESLLVGAVADCFILTFRSIARASQLEWTAINCEAEGILDKVDKVTKFTAFHLVAKLQVPAGANHDKARRLLEKAEQHCLITNSLSAEAHLTTEIIED